MNAATTPARTQPRFTSLSHGGGPDWVAYGGEIRLGDMLQPVD